MDKDFEFYKTAILQLMAGQNYEYYSQSELAEMFDLKDTDFTKERYEECLREYREVDNF